MALRRNLLETKKNEINVPYNEIWYTTADKQIIDLTKYDNAYSTIGGIYDGPTILSNKYVNGKKGIIKFSNDVTRVGTWNDKGTIKYCCPLFYNSSYGITHKLTSVYFPDSITSIETYTSSRFTLTEFYGCDYLKTVKLPNNVMSIGNSTFEQCKNLTEIEIPNTVTRINDCLLCDCHSLAKITLPEFITYIGFSSFCRCRQITEIVIPNTVTNICKHSFYDCRNLSNVICNPIQPPTLEIQAFYGNSSNRLIKVPSESLNAYKVATNWSAYSSSIVSQ